MNIDQFEDFCNGIKWKLSTEIIVGRSHLRAEKRDKSYNIIRELEVGMDLNEFKESIEEYEEQYSMMLFD